MELAQRNGDHATVLLQLPRLEASYAHGCPELLNSCSVARSLLKGYFTKPHVLYKPYRGNGNAQRLERHFFPPGRDVAVDALRYIVLQIVVTSTELADTGLPAIIERLVRIIFCNSCRSTGKA